MSPLLPDVGPLTAFAVASLVLAATPGPGVFYIVARSIGQGRRAGLASVAGVALGNLGNAVGASLGLAALFAVSAVAFTAVRYIGAAYLVWLGIQALRAATPGGEAAVVSGYCAPARVFRDGLVVALLNPKTAIFFSAFLPQFMQPADSPVLQSLTLGSAFVAIAALTDTIYAITASGIAPALARLSRRPILARCVRRYLPASAFIGLGVFTAVSDARRA